MLDCTSLQVPLRRAGDRSSHFGESDRIELVEMNSSYKLQRNKKATKGRKDPHTD